MSVCTTCTAIKNPGTGERSLATVSADYHLIPTNGPIRADYDTDIVGLAFLYDPKLQAVETPHGHVDFIQAFGITQSELSCLLNKTKKCEEIIEHHRKANPLLITDLARKDV